MSDVTKVLVVDDDRTIQMLLRMELNAAGFEVVTADDGHEALVVAAEEQPDAILLDMVMPGMDGLGVLRELRLRPQSAVTPVILLTGRPLEAAESEALMSGADHYMTKPFDIEKLIVRIKAIVARSGKVRDLSPLTRLPGNARIEHVIRERIEDDERFALIHADIDYFKALNDHYGFLHGDRVIEFCAAVLLQAASDIGSPTGFVGHIGGDDFAIVVDPDEIDQFCKSALDAFDEGIVQFYEPEDLAAKGISVEDRMGVVRHFPITSLSMGVATNSQRQFSSPAEASSIAAEMKHFAKKQDGSNYQVDRRHT